MVNQDFKKHDNLTKPYVLCIHFNLSIHLGGKYNYGKLLHRINECTNGQSIKKTKFAVL